MSQSNTKFARIQYNMHTASEWKTTNEILLFREIGYELDTGRYKIGTNATPTAWNDLPYASNCILTCTVTPDDYITKTTTGGQTYYTATIPVEGITQYDNPIIQPSLSTDIDVAILEDAAFNTINNVIAKDGEIELYNFSTKPLINFTLKILVN